MANIDFNMISCSKMKCGRRRGFTLVEVVIAISLMAVMSVLSWRALEGMTKAQGLVREHSDNVMLVQSGLGQWQHDLDSMTEQPNAFSLLWDGQVLRILRRSADSSEGREVGLRIVAWTLRVVDNTKYWVRWQSPFVRTRGELQREWLNAAHWAQNPSEEEILREIRIFPVEQWQLVYHVNGNWTNPLSSLDSGAQAKLPASAIVPEGIRLILTLSPEQTINGTLVRDWIRPDVVRSR